MIGRIYDETNNIYIGTATYEIAKYLNKLLTPLRKSECNILNTEDLTRKLIEETIPAEYKMFVFDVESLSNNVPLDKTIDFILKKVNDEKKIQNNIPKTVLKRTNISLHQTVSFHFR